MLEGLLRAKELVVEQAEAHYLALNACAAKPVEFADAVTFQLGRRAGCAETVTFDRGAAAGAKMRLLEA